MHLTSTINPKTQSTEDVPVIIVNLDGQRKFLPRPETFKDLQRLVRSHYKVETHTVLQFHVSSLDVCEGQDVEVTESVYPFLAPLLDVISVSAAHGHDSDTGVRTPAATPPPQAGAGADSEDQGEDDAQSEHSAGNLTATLASARLLNPPSESEDEEVFAGSRYGGDDDASDSDSVKMKQEEEDEDAPHARRVLNAQFPALRLQVKQKPKGKETLRDEQQRDDARAPKAEVRVQAKQEPHRTPKRRDVPRQATPPVAGPSRTVNLNRADSTATVASQRTASGPDERFKIQITGPRPEHRADFTTRGRHLVQKVLAGACNNFDLDIDRARLMLCLPMEEDGEEVVHRIECNKEETLAQSGVGPQSILVVVMMEEEEEDGDFY